MILSLFGGLGRRRRAPVGAGRLLGAIERGDAAIVELRALQRAAFLGDALGAERGVAAGELLILLALLDVRLRRLVGIVGRRLRGVLRVIS
jgi:hypothetical protein